ncbi:hypothetical protein P170DRAFT_424541 [Aspergillus steynii IBT 23096]|uniref:Uncharacterized protein n=1 Tax=Aspergillus steynii IBT 23096 TaxID=1392250 RepID=A0A2I2GB71_9EURO|nr:uncharacterized protein P170DRAFT_424541 [Aspergillus steynii IBT 23096]PLB50120.1 hypothetical protein P170DRAFT_424541 [Aspergillus steynii IBT 23096]
MCFAMGTDDAMTPLKCFAIKRGAIQADRDTVPKRVKIVYMTSMEPNGECLVEMVKQRMHQAASEIRYREKHDVFTNDEGESFLQQYKQLTQHVHENLSSNHALRSHIVKLQDENLVLRDENCGTKDTDCRLKGTLAMSDAEHALEKEKHELEAKLNTLKKDKSALEADMQTLADQNSALKDEMTKCMAIQKRYLDTRERTFLTWIRKLWDEHDELRNARIRRLNREVIHSADIIADAAMVSERFEPEQSERTLFPWLYGLDPETVIQLSESRECPESLQELNRMASYLLNRDRKRLTDDDDKKRKGIVANIKARDYDGAEGFARGHIE